MVTHPVAQGIPEDIDMDLLEPGTLSVVDVSFHSASVQFVYCEDHLLASITSIPDVFNDAEWNLSHEDCSVAPYVAPYMA